MVYQSLLKGCSSGNERVVAKEEDPFYFSFDLCGNAHSSTVNWQTELPLQESFFDVFPIMEGAIPSDPPYASLDIEDDIGGLSVWNELGSLFEPKKQMFLLCNNNPEIESSSTGEMKEEKKARKRREEKVTNSISKTLTRDKISKYFYMPITQAASELNVGLTLLKKRCRELGIRRWPHRKLMSLQTLIKNFEEIKRVGGEESEEKLKEEIEILERERKLVEKMPDMQLESKTKRLRQACFKANYKKRKLMRMIDSSCSFSSGSSSIGHRSAEASFAHHEMVMMNEEDDGEEIKSLWNEPFSHSNNLMF